eukprot:3523539-Amphidinium_carterae.1
MHNALLLAQTAQRTNPSHQCDLLFQESVGSSPSKTILRRQMPSKGRACLTNRVSPCSMLSQPCALNIVLLQSVEVVESIHIWKFIMGKTVLPSLGPCCLTRACSITECCSLTGLVSTGP